MDRDGSFSWIVTPLEPPDKLQKTTQATVQANIQKINHAAKANELWRK
jgi:hypothetical protein